MSGIVFLSCLAIILIMGIIVIFIFQTINYMSLTEYRKCWKPIYQNRIAHFDKYLKFALECRKEYNTIKDIASYAACMNYEYSEISNDEKINKDTYIEKKKNEYLHELECAGIE